MRTKHSIDLKLTTDRCFAARDGACGIKLFNSRICNSFCCPFYKPEGCKDWIRVEESNDITIVPPEEYFEIRRREVEESERVPVWRIVRRRVKDHT